MPMKTMTVYIAGGLKCNPTCVDSEFFSCGGWVGVGVVRGIIMLAVKVVSKFINSHFQIFKGGGG